MWEEEDLRAIEEAKERQHQHRPRRRRCDAARGRWDRKHLGSIGTKLPRPIVREIKDYCVLAGTTPYALVRQQLLEWLRTQRRRYD